jgi:hypothetical protein
VLSVASPIGVNTTTKTTINRSIPFTSYLMPRDVFCKGLANTINNMSSKNIPTKQATSGNNSSVLFDAFCNVLKSASSRSVGYQTHKRDFFDNQSAPPSHASHTTLVPYDLRRLAPKTSEDIPISVSLERESNEWRLSRKMAVSNPLKGFL